MQILLQIKASHENLMCKRMTEVTSRTKCLGEWQAESVIIKGEKYKESYMMRSSGVCFSVICSSKSWRYIFSMR
ncbi:hypothetical protein TNCT_462691 [Trichonephila clavata]|uniref:Uncharacterized protein n=1 Tax=Trichonephila clavata TaxID=2740835 RepID=A0A8X6FU02_TRICU|nr:hypothetical protein TNCT_462691 [Trichonephila clavata]